MMKGGSLCLPPPLSPQPRPSWCHLWAGSLCSGNIMIKMKMKTLVFALILWQWGWREGLSSLLLWGGLKAPPLTLWLMRCFGKIFWGAFVRLNQNLPLRWYSGNLQKILPNYQRRCFGKLLWLSEGGISPQWEGLLKKKLNLLPRW